MVAEVSVGRGASWRGGLAVVAAGGTGLLDIGAGLGIGRRVEGTSWFPAPQSSPVAMVLLGVALVLVAQGLRRRHLLALVLGALYFALAAANTVHGPRPAFLVAVAGLVVFALAQREAVVRVAPERLEAAGRAAIGTVVGLTVAGTVALLVADARLDQRPSFSSAVQLVARRLFGATSDLPGNRAADMVLRALPIAMGVVALVLLLIVLQPVVDDAIVDDETRERVRQLCTGPGSDAMAPFTRRQDKSYVFSPDGRAVIGYRLVLGVCLAGPGPVGDPASHDAALAAWIERCDERGWFPAMIAATDDTRARTRVHRMHGIRIGDEVTVPVVGFQLAQPAMRNVRQAVQRTRNAGVSVTVVRESELGPTERDLLGAVLAEWQRGHGERGFAMTLDRLLAGTYGEALVFIAHHEGRAVGFQRYLPCREGLSLSLDVMPRLRRAPNGVNERLIVEAIQHAAQHGGHELSLNFAAFRTVFEGRPTPSNRALRRVVHLLDRFINVESLYRFNAKFHPNWAARHVLFRSPLDLPWLLAAALRAEFGRPGDAEVASSPVGVLGTEPMSRGQVR
jgi:lysyl-tRNA synthetase class 2